MTLEHHVWLVLQFKTALDSFGQVELTIARKAKLTFRSLVIESTAASTPTTGWTHTSQDRKH